MKKEAMKASRDAPVRRPWGWLLSPVTVATHGPGELLQDSVILVLLVLSAMLVSYFLSPLNALTFLFVRLGSLLLLLLVLAIAIYACRMIAHAWHGMANLRRPYKIALFMLVLLLAAYAYAERDTFGVLLFEGIDRIPFRDIYPLTIGPEVESPRPWQQWTLDTSRLERRVFDLVNDQRTAAGLNALGWDGMLASVARAHSREIALNRVVAHERTLRVLVGGVGENIGYITLGDIAGYGLVQNADDAAAAMVRGWMRSPDHYANILEPSYRFTGIGVAYDEYNGFAFVQEFR